MSLERDERFEVCAEAADAAAAVDAAERHRPDICLLDLRMPGGGAVAAHEIAARLPETRIVMLTVSEDKRDLLASLRAGAVGFLPKSTDPRRLPAALADAAAGIAALPRSLTGVLIDELRTPLLARRRLAAGTLPTPLTSREWEILHLVSSGASDAQVARRLGISRGTVRWYVHSFLKKLNLPDRDALRREFAEIRDADAGHSA